MPPLLPGRSAPRWLAATLQFIGTVAVAIWLVTVLPWLLLFCLLLALLLIPTLRRLRTELSKLPGPAEAHLPLLALLPAEGAGLTLERLRQLEDRPVSATADALRDLAAELLQAAHALADQIGERFFTLARGQDQRI
jgi:hypothetical protein